MAAQPHLQRIRIGLAAIVAGLSCVASAAFADEPAQTRSDSATWYVVGGPEADTPARTYRERSPDGQRSSRVDVGVTLSRLSPADIMTFTAGPAAAERTGSYAFLVSGAYDFDTGTLVTPRILGGVGVSYLGADRAGGFSAGDPTARQDMAPTAQIGFGANFDLGDNWALSAEYRAQYLGETERPGSLGESRLDQKFTVGARIRF